MTFEELKSKEVEIIKKADYEVNGLRKLYALENNTVSVGDVIEDHYQKIKVEKLL